MRYLILSSFLLSLSLGPAFAQDASEPPVVASSVSPDESPLLDASVASEAPVLPVEAPSSLVSAAPLQDPLVAPETDSEASALFIKLLDAAQNGHWTVFGGILILLLVFIFNRMGLASLVGTRFVPWVSLGVGALAGVALSLAGGVAIWDSILAGLLNGGMAITLWELIFKNITSHRSDGSPR